MLAGIPVSEGIAMGQAYRYDNRELEVRRERFGAGEEEEKLEALRRALCRAGEELAGLAEAPGPDGREQGDIFRAQMGILEDEGLLLPMEALVREERLEPEAAVEKVFGEAAGRLAGAEDPLVAARSADIRDVEKRLIRICQGREERTLSGLEKGVILVAKDLLPSDTAALDRTHVQGIITQAGGSSSHSAILARSFGIPAVAGVAAALERIPHGALVALDAEKGEVIVEPLEEEIGIYRRRQGALSERRRREERYLARPGATRDGAAVGMGINVSSCQWDVPNDYYDFVGLLRTELLYMENSAPPSEEEQFQAYRRALLRAGGKSVTLRTLDIGGDKTLPYMPLPKEENPFLGSRGLRLCLERPELFLTQLRAALRASAYGHMELLFPMVGSMEDIRLAKSYVREAMGQLDRRRLSYDAHIRLGIMVEVPSMALAADLAAAEVDFAGIGTNDLTQYVCAADRTNPKAAAYYQSYSPAMLRLLEGVFAAFGEQNRPVCVCGEMAGSPRGAVLLTGLGARRLSMSPGCLAGVKAALAKVTLEEAKALAARCRQLRTQGEILEYLGM